MARQGALPDAARPARAARLPHSHIDPFTGDDDTYDIDSGTGAILSRLPPLSIPQADMPAPGGTVVAPARPQRALPLRLGRKYKHCHGAVA